MSQRERPTEDDRRLIRVFLTDDHAGFRAVVAAVVEATDGFALVGSAASGEDALCQLGRLPSVDLLLMDFALPGIDGIETVERYRSAGGMATAVLLSTADEADLPADLLDRGFSAFLPKASFSRISLGKVWASGDRNRRN